MTDDEGWIETKGKAPPEAVGKAYLRFRGGRETELPVELRHNGRSRWRWTQSGSDFDITHYQPGD